LYQLYAGLQDGHAYIFSVTIFGFSNVFREETTTPPTRHSITEESENHSGTGLWLPYKTNPSTENKHIKQIYRTMPYHFNEMCCACLKLKKSYLPLYMICFTKMLSLLLEMWAIKIV
jgi:hypothetical protein